MNLNHKIYKVSNYNIIIKFSDTDINLMYEKLN